MKEVPEDFETFKFEPLDDIISGRKPLPPARVVCTNSPPTWEEMVN